MPLNVFVSHSMGVRDLGILEGLLEQAQGRAITYYLAERDPRFGHQLPEKIKAALREADCVLVLWTADGAHSGWVNQEIGFAEQLGKLVIPVVERGVFPRGFLVGKEYIELDREEPSKTIHVATDYLERVRIQAEGRQRTAMVVLGVLGLLLLLSGDR